MLIVLTDIFKLTVTLTVAILFILKWSSQVAIQDTKGIEMAKRGFTSFFTLHTTVRHNSMMLMACHSKFSRGARMIGVQG